MNGLSREEACRIINDIRRKNGGISRDARERLLQTDPEVLEALDSLRTIVASSTKILAEQLYSKDTRFVFELIQNAEDNHYTIAQAEDKLPFLRFSLFPDKIVIDSNEDGFKEDNVRAICQIGKSTKRHVRGYIGEKGIGFKSIFKVASTVHIQSGPFSFSFNHAQDDEGLGMVTPDVDEHAELPADVRTRMTLVLAKTSNVRQHMKDFDNLPDTLLLFLTKLKSLHIENHLNDVTSKVTYHYQDQAGMRGTLTKRTVSGEGENVTVNHYCISKKLLKNLPRDAARTHNSAEVVLAFPVDENDIPIIRPQHVFAFLPLSIVGFSFLIQSDFIAQANREGLSQTLWNDAIRDGVADVFVSSVVRFCEHPTLQFQWLEYMPSKSIVDPFWSQLLPRIQDGLKVTPLLRTWSGQRLEIPRRLRLVADEYLDQQRQPLFKDLAEEIYLSPKYLPDHKGSLEELGVKMLKVNELIERVEADLDSSDSRMKSPTTDETWHARAAQAILRNLNSMARSSSDRSKELTGRIRDLQLIPLQGGKWISPNEGPAFFQTIEDIPTPEDLGLSLAIPEVSKNTSRKDLFLALGVRYPKPEGVIKRIRQRYSTYNAVDLQSSVSHLRYLYRYMPISDTELYGPIYLKDQSEQSIYRNFVTIGRQDLIVDDLYFESSDEYGTQQLVKPVASLGPKRNMTAPGFQARFINSKYLVAVDASQHRSDLSWEGWLEKFAGVRRVPRLQARRLSSTGGNQAISLLFRYIMEKRRDKLIGTLQAHWDAYKSEMNAEVVGQLSKALVPCRDVEDTPLGDTYLPLPNLINISEDLGVPGRLPFLKLPSKLEDEDRQKWNFLRTFSVGDQPDLRFHLEILRVLIKEDHSTMPLTVGPMTSLFKVYEEIARLSMESNYEDIRNFFKSQKAIYLPYTGGRNPKWVDSTQCLWKAPDFLVWSHPLISFAQYRENERLTRLFRSILQIPNVTWREYISQLNYYRALSRPPDLGQISEIYQLISRDTIDAEGWDTIREAFEGDSLVYISPQEKWVRPRECLWTESTQISGKYAIENIYHELLNLFNQRLGVKKPDIRMFIEELKSRSARFDVNNPPIREMRALIEDLNKWGPQKGDLKDLLQCKILPVRSTDNELSLKSTAETFAIVDRAEYGETFRGKVPYLDYSIEEVRKLRSFITAMGLESRYMSSSVKEFSFVIASSKVSRLSEEFQQKASAFYRCAVHFGSFDSEDKYMYRKLAEANIYESDGISKTVTISINGEQRSVLGAKGKIHIEEIDDKLQIYVPRDQRERELCYLVQFPPKLASHLNISEQIGIKVLGDLLKASIVVVKDVLIDHGIVQVPGLLESVRYITPREESDESNLDEITRRASRLTLIQRSESCETEAIERGPGLDAFNQRVVGGSVGEGNSESSSDYQKLLDSIINAASIGHIPKKDYQLKSENGLRPVDLPESLFGTPSEDRFQHNSRKGAAGELYVFELLSRMNLPNFSRANWQSRIRKEVCVHQKYADMKPWNERETADIVYEDTESVLTRALNSLGYLPDRVRDLRPKYYLEVKTTTCESDARFFMSQGEYELMQRCSGHFLLAPNEIYIILRIFNIGQERIGIHIYVDPESMRIRSELEFTAEKYFVVPKGPTRNDNSTSTNGRSPTPLGTSSGDSFTGFAGFATSSRTSLGTSASAFDSSGSSTGAGIRGIFDASTAPSSSTSTVSPHTELTDCGGTSKVNFVPYLEKDATTGIWNRFQSIGLMQEYQKFSFDELRLEDYRQNRRYGTTTSLGGFGSGNIPQNTSDTSAGHIGVDPAQQGPSLSGASVSSTQAGFGLFGSISQQSPANDPSVAVRSSPQAQKKLASDVPTAAVPIAFNSGSGTLGRPSLLLAQPSGISNDRSSSARTTSTSSLFASSSQQAPSTQSEPFTSEPSKQGTGFTQGSSKSGFGLASSSEPSSSISSSGSLFGTPPARPDPMFTFRTPKPTPSATTSPAPNGAGIFGPFVNSNLTLPGVSSAGSIFADSQVLSESASSSGDNAKQTTSLLKVFGSPSPSSSLFDTQPARRRSIFGDPSNNSSSWSGLFGTTNQQPHTSDLPGKIFGSPSNSTSPVSTLAASTSAAFPTFSNSGTTQQPSANPSTGSSSATLAIPLPLPVRPLSTPPANPPRKFRAKVRLPDESNYTASGVFGSSSFRHANAEMAMANAGEASRQSAEAGEDEGQYFETNVEGTGDSHAISTNKP